MNYFDWFSISLICFMGAATPGPSLIIILYQTSISGIKGGIICSIGHGFGIFFYAMLTCMGVGLIIINFPIIFSIIKTVGLFFLIFIGIQMMAFKKDNLINYNPQISNKNSFIVGFFTAFLNPKIILFFLSIFSQFVNIQISIQNKVYIAFLASIIDSIWYILVVLLLNNKKIQLIKKYKKIFIKLMGFSMIIIVIIII